jgi:glycerol uptake facilitator-like aquaporin
MACRFVATFGLLITILGCILQAGCDRVRRRSLHHPAYWFTASTSFANPAVTIGRSLSDTFGIAPSDVPGFIVAQILGALAAPRLAAGCSPGVAAAEKRRAARSGSCQHSAYP